MLEFIENLYPKQRQFLSKITQQFVQNLVTENDQQCPIYASLLLKFAKRVSFLMHQNMSIFVKWVYPKIFKIWLRYSHQFVIVQSNWTFHVLVYVTVCEKILLWHLTQFSWFKSCSHMTIGIAFSSLDERTRNSLPRKKICLFRWSLFSSWWIRQ